MSHDRRRCGGGAGWCRRGFWIPVLAVATLLLPQRLHAQEPPVDSTRTRVLDAVKRLSRPPTPDSLVALADTSDLLLADSAGATRRARPRAAPAETDSIMGELLALPGYSPTRYEGDRAEFEAEQRQLLLLAGEGAEARIQREGIELQTDSAIVYNETTRRVRSTGQSVYTPDQGDPVESTTMIYDLDEARGSALNARTQYSQGANWIVTGDLPWVDMDVAFGSHTRFTSCELEVPHYHFETDEIKIVAGKVLVARPVRLYFADVPVAWLPFIAQGLGRGRSSGILTPRFSINDVVRTSSGYRRRVSNVGFFWAVNDYSDATVALDWFSDEFMSVTGAFRYNILRKFLQGDVNFRQYWRSDGGSELAFDTRHNWELSERTKLRASARYASSTDFVRRNSFDPRELTQSIDSDGGLNHRFDWGNLSLSANRRQYLSDDRVEMTLPQASLSLSTITLFRAPPSRARWFNNLTWSGGVNVGRSTVDLAAMPDSAFSFSRADQVNTRAGFSSNLNLGPLSWSQSLNVTEKLVREVPDSLFAEASLLASGDDRLGASAFDLEPEAGFRDLAQADLTWNMSLNYQQRLIGSTTLTPTVTLSGRALRSDSIPVATGFVSAPSRMSVGAQLKTDIYGFFPGFASFERVRHKLSPSFNWRYSPEATPTARQRRVFGAREIQPKNVLSIGFNQTFEAKEAVDTPEGGDTAAADSAEAGIPGRTPDAGPRRAQEGRIVRLLGIQTSVIEYDFVEADSAGSFIEGFTTTRLRNTVTSDFLRGMNVSLEHDLFKTVGTGASTGLSGGGRRRFAPHLSQLNLSFSLGSNSALFRWLGVLLGGEPQAPAPDEEEEELEDPFEDVGGIQESQVVPGVSRSGDRRALVRRPGGRGGGRGGWNANLSYSLRRPRGEGVEVTQMLQGTLSFEPTEKWSVNWRTSYDIEAGSFNDHILRLTRDLHRWDASFDFRQTATGNWTFRFEVSLRDNPDLKLDYAQRSLEDPRRF